MNPLKLLALSELERVADPEMGLDVVTMGLIYDLTVNPEAIELKMSLTSRSCPMGDILRDLCKNSLERIAGSRQVKINLVWDPPWQPDMITEEGKIALSR